MTLILAVGTDIIDPAGHAMPATAHVRQTGARSAMNHPFFPLRILRVIVSVLLLGVGTLPASAGESLPDTDLPGGDYRSFELISPLPKFCEQVCGRDSRCKAWTFSWPGKRAKRAKCFLKDSVPEKKADTCCISGIKGASGLAQTPRSGEEGQSSAQDDTARAAPRTPSASSDRGGVDARPSPDGKPDETHGGEASAAGTEAEPSVPALTPENDQARVDLEEKRRFCEAYADAAMRANAENERLGCGFQGGRWGSSRRGYFNWCMRNDRQKAEANTRARERAIARCRANPPAVIPEPPGPATPPADDDPFGGPPLGETPRADLESCRLYARLSVRQARNARRLGCAVGGSEWSVAQDRHFEACRRMTVAERDRMLRMRARTLAACRRNRPALITPSRPPAPVAEPGGDMRFRSAPFLYQWVQLRGPGGPWRTRWRASFSGKCPLVRACDCGEGTCGVYPPGATALMWRRGCAAPPSVIQCRVRRR